MAWYPPQDGAVQAQDKDGTTFGLQSVVLGPFIVPPNFIGRVKANVSARVIQANPAAETSYLATLTVDIRKQAEGSACVVVGQGSRHVSGDDNFNGADYLLSAVLQPSSQWPGAMEVKFTGRDNATVYWDTRVRVEGRVITGDG